MNMSNYEIECSTSEIEFGKAANDTSYEFEERIHSFNTLSQQQYSSLPKHSVMPESLATVDVNFFLHEMNSNHLPGRQP
jgi:hypothetical protein